MQNMQGKNITYQTFNQILHTQYLQEFQDIMDKPLYVAKLLTALIKENLFKLSLENKMNLLVEIYEQNKQSVYYNEKSELNVNQHIDQLLCNILGESNITLHINAVSFVLKTKIDILMPLIQKIMDINPEINELNQDNIDKLNISYDRYKAGTLSSVDIDRILHANFVIEKLYKQSSNHNLHARYKTSVSEMSFIMENLRQIASLMNYDFFYSKDKFREKVVEIINISNM